MSRVLLTGATGYLGSYVAQELLTQPDVTLDLLVRAHDRRQAVEKLWHAWQLQLSPEAFREALRRVRFHNGDLHAAGLGLSDTARDELVEGVTSILHVAASLNRKSEKACLNTNLKGGLEVLRLARRMKDLGQLQRYGFVSTVAIAGERAHEDVDEDHALDWRRSDYDPYARTKKFGEHMVRELLPDVRTVVYRPSIVMGDPTLVRTMQFDMVRATFALAELPVVPLVADSRVDIVDAPFVGKALARLHLKEDLQHDTYHLSAGTRSSTPRTILDALAPAMGRRPPCVPGLGPATELAIRAMNQAPRKSTLAGIGALMKVFWPYITYDTVFRNDRVTTELGMRPTPFETYAADLHRWCTAHAYRYPHLPLPAGIS